MIDRMARGDLPGKHHLAFRDAAGAWLHEECWTRQGFDGPYTILYHRHRPHAARAAEARHGFPLPRPAPPRPLRRRHYRIQALSLAGGPAVDARTPLLFNEDLCLSLCHPSGPDPVYLANGDGDDLYFVHQGGGLLRSALGDLRFGQGDYLCLPRGLLHRFLPDPGVQRWLHLECLGGLSLPRQWRNEAGQLRMDAPFSHRDFRRPEFQGPLDEGIREVVVKRGGAFHGLAFATPPLDVVGWDGSVWPFAVPILAFQAKVAMVHLPPTWHGTFALRGALVCSFVPRPLDWHPEAVPCPYPHASVDVDEVLFYDRGEFTSRRGVGAGSLSHHPAGIPHGPHPGAYEGSLGKRWTDELAVMLDCYRPLLATPEALAIEDPGYHDGFAG
ncbi:MAG TPA: homogentisate 1,2-dioxygenase [Anaeromyxobacteraceae bacterium]|nr:homogentisate 1,2-dioxygenase [Anaeromyxobacteraceae bacterium]